MRTLHISMIFPLMRGNRATEPELLTWAKPITDEFAKWHPRLHQWWLKADTVAEALRHPLFDGEGEPAQGASAELAARDEYKTTNHRIFGAWNGEEGAHGAHFSYSHGFGKGDRGKLNAFVARGSLPGSAATVSATLSNLCVVFKPFWAAVASYDYDPIFKDRPGVGWMLYLPRILTPQQVPEARALIPVFAADQRQLGTIIVSVADEVFSDQNPEHTRIAHAIETRLVDQDLLPRFADL